MPALQLLDRPLRCHLRFMYLWSVITFFGTDSKFRYRFRRADLNLNFAPGTIHFFVGRPISYRVLVPQISRDPPANFLDVPDVSGKERGAASGFRNLLQSLPAFISKHDVGGRQEANGVHNDFGFLKECEYLFQLEFTVIVLTITHYEQDPLVMESLIFEVLCGQIAPIIKSSIANGWDPVQCIP